MINGTFSYQTLSILLLAAIALPSCKDPRTIQTHMRPLTALIDYYDTAHGVTLRVKKLDAHDCELLLGKQSQRLFKKIRKRPPIWPIQISVTNETDKLISLKPNDINLPQLSYRQVAARLHKNSLGQIVGTLASSLLIGGFLAMGSFLALSGTGILILTTGSFSLSAPFAVLGGSALAAVPAFLIVGTPVLSTIRGVQTVNSNHSITRDLKKSSINHHMIVPPHSTKDVIIFVSRKDYKHAFNVSISHPENANRKISFKVTIPDSPYTVSRK